MLVSAVKSMVFSKFGVSIKGKLYAKYLLHVADLNNKEPPF